jgi:hypothetical protein
MRPQLRRTMQAPPPTGCAGKAPPPGLPGVGGGAGVTVTLDDAAVVVSSSVPYPTLKASTAATPHTTIAVLPCGSSRSSTVPADLHFRRMA